MVDGETQQDEAIDCCPVNCISRISWDDLVISEIRRKGEVINPYGIFSEMAGSVSKEAMMSNRWKTEAASRVQLEWNEENVEKSKRTGI